MNFLALLGQPVHDGLIVQQLLAFLTQDFDHLAPVGQVLVNIGAIRRPVGALLCIRWRSRLVDAHEVANEVHVKGPKLRVFAQAALARRPEVQAHPHAAVGELEAAAALVRRSALRVPRARV